MIGQTVSHYKNLEPLGEGGMGVVYKAEDTKLQRSVALKFLPENLARNAEARARLLQEARAAAALNHPNICTIYEIGEADDRFFIAMEYVEGETLRQKATSAPLPVASVINFALQIAAGLQAAHEKGIFHRDIKSSNIMVTRKDQIKIMDFGLAKLAGSSFLTKEKSTMGTVAYMSPEQVRGKKVDQRTDLWSFGVVLYEMLAGQLPFQSDHEQVLIYAIINETPEPMTDLRPDVPPALEAIVEKALQRSLSARYQCVDELLFDLRKLLSSAEISAPPAKTVSTRTNNLPAQSTPLIGREAEIEAVTQLLLRPEVRLLTLTGPGGTGKTRLGLQVATNALTVFDDGVFFVSLVPISEPALVLLTIAETLGVFLSPLRSLSESIIAHLVEKKLLLVLDNFEQVVAAAPGLAELLAACPQLKILVTSRVVLRLTGEHEFAVQPLATPDPKQTLSLEALGHFAAIELFRQRAQSVQPNFTITHENAKAIAEICYRLDGLPLAIELAAARLKIFSPQAILARLEKRFELLKGGPRDVPRHQTLRQAIAWSYDLLNRDEQTVFRRMAVFTGGCTLEAVEALCHAMADLSISALDGVAALIDRSLLRQDQTEDTEPRFMMLETIREFALEALQASGEWEKVRRVHADFFVALAEKAGPELTGAKLKVWLTKLEREHDNFRAIFKWVAETGAAEDGLRLGSVIWRFWNVRGYLLEGREQLTTLLALPGAAQRTTLRASVLNALAIITFQLSDYCGARPFLYESLEIARELGDKRNIGLAISNLSWTGSILGELKAAQEWAEESLALYRELNDKRGISVAFNNLGWAMAFSGDFNLSQEFMEKSLRLRQEIADERGIGFAMMNLGWVEGMLGRFEKATTLMEEALQRLEALGDKQLIAFVKSWGGYMFVHQGNFTRARNLLEESVLVMREIGSKLGLGLSSYSLGVIAHEQDDANHAGELLEGSVMLFRESGFKWGVVRALYSLGHLALDGNGTTRVQICYQESLQQAQESNDRLGLANALIGFGRLSLAAGKLDRAARLLAAAEALHTTTGAVMPVFQRSRFDRDLAATRAGLGEQAFAAEYETGKKMAVEGAIAYALDEAGTLQGDVENQS